MTIQRVLGLLALVLGAAAWAQGAPADGEVRKIDKDGRKITLKHGEIKSLDMPPMSMAYQVKDPQMLERVKVGDKVSFTVEKIGGVYTLTAIDPAK